MEQNKDQSGEAVRGEAVAEGLREIDAVLAENDRLRDALADKISGETLLIELNANRGGLNMQFEGGACQILAEQFAQQFREMGGDNYIEMGFTARSDGMPLLVTIQRVSGKTPATLKNEAEAKLATAKNFHRSLCDRFGYSHDDKDWLRDLVSLEEFIAAKVSARAADAPSEPSESAMRAVLLNAKAVIQRWDSPLWRQEVHTAAWINQLRKSVELAESRAADALDSQPTEPWTRTEDRLPPVETPVFIIHSGDVKIGEIRWENPSHEETFEAFMYWDDPNDDGQSWDWLEVTHWMQIPPAPASSQPTDGKGVDHAA